MNSDALITQLERFATVLPAVVAGLSDDEARWKPNPEGWAVVEIVAHLADEETEDFRTRLRLTLEEPTTDWPGINPEAAAVERRYLERSLGTETRRFVDSRHESIAWLRGLGERDWTIAHTHPKFGSMRAGDLLASWAAHDALHLRQIAKRRFQRTVAWSSGFSTSYAGAWTA